MINSERDPFAYTKSSLIDKNLVSIDSLKKYPFHKENIQCGTRPLVKSARIVGGENATYGEWPWQVMVLESNSENFCGGVLISEDLVVTSASCQIFSSINFVMDNELECKLFRYET